MGKTTRLTAQQKELIYELYDKNIKQKLKPDYEGIVRDLMKVSPPILITKEAVCYHIKRRNQSSHLKIEKAKNDLATAKKEHEDLTGQQASELDFNSGQSPEITVANTPVMLKYWDALSTKFKLELEQGRYVHADDVAKKFTAIYEVVELTLKAIQTRLISAITPASLEKKYFSKLNATCSASAGDPASTINQLPGEWEKHTRHCPSLYLLTLTFFFSLAIWYTTNK
ncbi:MAG: hypothetical protein ACRCVN_06110 [Spirochaetia bacterium]